MAIYINGAPLDMKTIKMESGKWYDGQDEVKMLISQAWQEIEKKFFNRGEVLIFKTPGIRSGMGKGNQGYAYPRVVDYKTKKGKVKIAWADDVKVEDGRTIYMPLLRRIGINEKTLRLGPDEIEEAIFMYLFNPNVVSPKNPTGRTFLEDKEAEALKYEESETNNAVVSYWLFRKESPFYANEQKISTLCLAWGIMPEGKSITYKKQLLAESVKNAEKRKTMDMGLKAFNDACERMKDGHDTREIDTMALVNKCINAKVLKFDNEKYAWQLINQDGKSLKTFCKVPPQMAARSKELIKRHIIEHPDDGEILHNAITTESEPSKYDICTLSAPLPENITEEYITTVMSWPDRKRIYKFLGHDTTRATADNIHPILIEYFVLQGRTIPFEVKGE